MDSYTKTDQQLHLLSQILSKANRTFVPSKPDDSHTNLYFDSLGNRIVGRWIETQVGRILMSINLDNLNIELLNSSQKSMASIPTIGSTIVEIEQEISNHLSEMGLDPVGFTNKLHFEIPNYSFAEKAIEMIPSQDIDNWIGYRNMANEACASLLGYLQIEGEIRIWPHHFDTGIYAVTENGIGIGFGLAMEDTLIGSPYFYMSGYPVEGTLDYKDLPEFSTGRWEITENWNGAVLPLNELKSIPEEMQVDVIKSYLLTAVGWHIR